MEKEVKEYLKLLDIPISDRYFEKQMASHQDYPIFSAVADILQKLGVSHTVTITNQESYGDLPFPVLLHLEATGGSFFSVYNADDLEDSKEKLNHWSEVLIIVERAQKKQLKILTTVLLLVATGLVLSPLLVSYSWIQLFLIGIITATVMIGYFLFAKDLGITYRPVESFRNDGSWAGCGIELSWQFRVNNLIYDFRSLRIAGKSRNRSNEFSCRKNSTV